jgi:hypothetical protein
VLGQRWQQVAREAVAKPPTELDDALADALDHLARGDAVGAARVEPGLDLVVQVGDAHHVELVEVVLVDRAELDALEQGDRGVLGQAQDALVEVEPGELAVVVQRAVCEVHVAVAIGLRRRPGSYGDPVALLAAGGGAVEGFLSHPPLMLARRRGPTEAPTQPE